MMAPSTSELFRLEHQRIAALADGRAIEVAPMTVEAAKALGSHCATFGPWKHYGIGADQLTASFADRSGGNRPFEVRVGGELAGAIVVRDPWLIGPYLVFLGVLPSFQGQKAGDALLGWFEAEARRGDKRNIWLCVTGVNVDAQRFYRAHGWGIAATIPDLIRDGDDEIMIRKRLL